MHHLHFQTSFGRLKNLMGNTDSGMQWFFNFSHILRSLVLLPVLQWCIWWWSFDWIVAPCLKRMLWVTVIHLQQNWLTLEPNSRNRAEISLITCDKPDSSCLVFKFSRKLEMRMQIAFVLQNITNTDWQFDRERLQTEFNNKPSLLKSVKKDEQLITFWWKGTDKRLHKLAHMLSREMT